MSDVEPTINGVGGEGFAVDGTDSFAIEPTVPADEPGGAPPAGRRGLYLTLATGLALALIVVIAGSGGDDGESALRGESAASSTTTSTVAAERDRSSSAAESGRGDDDQRSSAGSDFNAEDMYTSEYDGLIIESIPYDDGLSDFEDFEDFDNVEDFEDFEDFDDVEDDDFSSSGGGRYLPRRVPYVPSTRRPTITLPPWYSGTATTTPSTTTTEATTPTVPETTAAPDTTPPAVPVINGALGATNDSTPRFAGNGEDGSTITLSEGTTVLCTVAVASGAWWCDSGPLTDGVHSITAYADDAAGNRATGPTVSVTIDTTPPEAPTISSPAAGSVTNLTPTVRGTGEDGSKVTISDGTSSLCTATVTLGGWSCTPTLTEGARTLTPTAVDAAWNSTPGMPVQVTANPASPVITAPADGSGTRDTTPRIAGTGADGSTVTVSVGTTPWCTAVVSLGTWACDATELAEGTYTFTTAAGTVPGTSITLTIDDAAPVVTQPADGTTVSTAAITFVGTAANGDTVTVSEGPATICTDVAAGGAWTCSSPTLIEGPHTFTTSARNAAGNSTPGASLTVTIDAP